MLLRDDKTVKLEEQMVQKISLNRYLLDDKMKEEPPNGSCDQDVRIIAHLTLTGLGAVVRANAIAQYFPSKYNNNNTVIKTGSGSGSSLLED